MKGRGPLGRPTGMSRSLFRPSDDAVTFPYHIPGNAMAYVELQHLIILLETILKLQSEHSLRVVMMRHPLNPLIFHPWSQVLFHVYPQMFPR